MTTRIGINGFGRISGTTIRAALNMPDIEVAAINVRNADLDHMAYMLKYDSTFGRLPVSVEAYDEGLVIDGKKVPVSIQEDVTKIDWAKYGAEYIIEGTGAFLTAEKARPHIENGGAKKVIMSAPAKDDTPMFVVGVNHETYTPDMEIVSNASCTTNCLAPMSKVLEDNFGIKEALMSTIHSATSKQHTVDSKDLKDWRIGRSVFNNIIPTTTGAAKAVAKVIPSLQGKMTGMAFRVPTADVSIVDLTVKLEKETSYDEICAAMKKASENELKDILYYCEDPCVTMDFVGEPCTSIFDVQAGIELNPTFFKIIGFYDNEFGYCTQMLRLASHMHAVDNK